MAQENICFNLPDSGMAVEILPYVKHKLAKQVNRALFGDETIELGNVTGQNGDIDSAAVTQKVKVKMTAMLDVADVKVKGMLVSFAGKPAVQITDDDLDELSQYDYDYLVKEVEKVFGNDEKQSDPKGLAAGNGNTSEV